MYMSTTNEPANSSTPEDTDDWDFGDTSPSWKCQSCGFVPDWKPPPEGWLNKEREGRLCRKCRSHSVIPVGL